MNVLISKLDKLDKIEDLVSKVDVIDTTTKNTDQRVLSIEKRVERIEAHMTATDEKIADMEVAFENLKQDFATHKESTDAKLQEKDTESQERIEYLEATNKSLTCTVNQLKAQQNFLAHAAEIVLSGIPLQPEQNLNATVFTIFEALNFDCSTEDIASVRVLGKKLVPDAAAAASDSAISENTPSTSASSSSSATSLGMLVVTFKNATLAKDAMSAKIRKGKLTNAMIPDDKLQAAGMVIPAGKSQTAININQFLTKDMYDLKRLVYKKSRVKGQKFITFMKEGCIYVRAKKDAVSVPIHSPEDLDAFLESLPKARATP